LEEFLVADKYKNYLSLDFGVSREIGGKREMRVQLIANDEGDRK
jgi:hypothetical protein